MYFGIGIIRKLVIPEPDVFIDVKYFAVAIFTASRNNSLCQTVGYFYGGG